LIIRLAPAIIASQELTMFLRRHHRTVAGKVLTYYTLVESVRTEAGPRQRTVAHLGELNAAEESRWQRTVAFHNRQGVVQQLRLFPDDDHVPLPDDPAIVRIRLDTVGWTNPRRFGDIWLAWQLWRRLKLDDIVNRHVPQGKHTVLPATVVAIEVINRLCAPCSEFALAEHWYASTGLEDLLGVSDKDVTKDRLYRTLDDLLKAQEPIENELKQQFGALFHITYDLMLYDLTSTYFEGLAEENDLARRGYSRDHRSDCKQVVLALVVTREGFPLAHYTLAGNVKDVQTVKKVVKAVEKRFGAAQRVWVMDRGMISKKTLAFLAKSPRKYLLATLRKEVARFQNYLGRKWQRLQEHRDIEVQPIKRGGLTYLLVRSKPRRQKERAMRRRQRRALALALRRLQEQIAAGRLKSRDKILERLGRLKGKYPRATPFVTLTVSKKGRVRLDVSWNIDKFKAALARDGVYLLRSNQRGWSAAEFWETYTQLTVVEHAFRVLKSHLWLRPVWHHYSGRVQAHIFICVLAYALWKTLDHLAKQAGLETKIRKPDPKRPKASPKDRPMTPEVILRELAKIHIGDILLETTEGQQLALRRVARPDAEQKRILAALQLEIPERLSPDRLL
jgi:transposase